jgi:hypothetical protein
MNDWILTNIEAICCSVVALMILVTAGVYSQFFLDVLLGQYDWYYRIFGRGSDRNNDEYIISASIILGSGNIVVSTVTIFLYLTVTGMPFMQFVMQIKQL